MTTKSSILRMLEEQGPLKDSELASHLGVAHQQVNQAARGLAAIGAIRRAAGADGILLNSLEATDGRAGPAITMSDVERSPRDSRSWPILGPVTAGTLVARDDLTGLGFVEHALERVVGADVPEGGLIGWNTIGAVPRAPGLYCFVGQKKPSSDLRVFYVGMTAHLWMIAKGQLPGGIARGGQRYGRPKHAGTTRQRVNAEVARLSADGWIFSHWLRAVQPSSDPATLEVFLRTEESHLIAMWNLRIDGWNRRE